MSDLHTLLLTDVVDSTQLNDELGDAAMTRLWEAHDRSARRLMVTWKAREIARSDGFLLLFDDVADAAGFAAAYHSTLRSIDTRLKARVGVHLGAVSFRENSDGDRLRGAPAFEIDGVALPIVARVMAAAQGGQTLLTAAAVQALDGDPAHTLKSHGHWRFKGVADPIEIFETGRIDALFEPPPDSAKAYRVVRTSNEWVPARQVPNNLPAERDAFIGRTGALQTLAALFEGPARLVTVLGIGGIGKTRMVVRYAQTWLGDYPGGAWFCDLSTARGLDGIVYAVAQALDIPLGKSDPVKQIASAIAAHGPCLVILDTFEQVARHAEQTLGAWLERAPESRFVVTSREVLGIAGEHTQVLAPMSEQEASELFVGRMAAVVGRNLLTSRDQSAIGPLVRLLDGLPLAIELAAARSRVMSPRMLLDRMHERFTLLTTRGGRLDRQVTLRATLDWSWDLLLQQERSALAQLSVFEGGFTLEAAEAVLSSLTGHTAMLPLDLLQSLVDKSFIRKIADDRFDLLQSVQEYGGQHLRSEGRFDGSGLAGALQTEVRHSLYYGGLSEVEVTAPGFLELDNMAIACRRAARRGDFASAARTLELAWSVLELRGPFRLGFDLAMLVSVMPGLPVSLVAGTLLIKGRALRALGKSAEAAASYELALGAARGVDDRRIEAEALSKLGSLKTNAGRLEEAGVHFRAGLLLARAIGNRPLECELLNGSGSLHNLMGQTDAALRDYEGALVIARQSGNRRWEGGVLGNLGNVYYNEGRIDEARRAHESGLVIAVDLGNRQWEANARCNIGLLDLLDDDPAAARRTLEHSLKVARDIGYARLEAIVLCNLGMVESAVNDARAARLYFQDALLASESLGDYLLQGQTLGYLGLLCCKHGERPEGYRHLQRGLALIEATDDESSLAIFHCNAAQSFLAAGDIAGAESSLQTATAITRSMGSRIAFDVRIALDRVDALLQSERTRTRSPPDAS